jgi:hypothetical protein
MSVVTTRSSTTITLEVFIMNRLAIEIGLTAALIILDHYTNDED